MRKPQSSNVVSLRDYENAGGKLTARDAARLLHACRDLAVERLVAAIGTMLHQVDDILFDLSSKDETGIFQSQYFDAMRQVRLKRDVIESEFRYHLLKGFQERVRASHEDGTSTELPEHADQLRLVDDDSLEETLAVKNMVAKASAACREELFQLDRRMGVLLRKRDLEGNDNPLGPEVICNAFSVACMQLGSETGMKLIALKLFERVVGAWLENFYREMNQHLVEHGVLPRVHASIRRTPAPPQQAHCPDPAVHPAAHGGQAASGDGMIADLFTAVRSLLGRSARPESAAGDGNGSVTNGSINGRSEKAGDSDVLDILTRLQQGETDAWTDYAGVSDCASATSGTSNILRQLRSSDVANRMGEVDALTLDVVTMLFDYILDDVNVPDAMKALIGRLQIPVLKVALIDKSLFSSKAHPVRRLLDSLAEAAIGWTEAKGKEDSLYTRVESVVHTVLERFEDDLNVFAELLEELEAFLAEEQHNVRKEAKQSVEALEGRGRLAQARLYAGEEITRRIEKNHVPVTVRDFLNTHWKDLLAVTYLQRGEESVQWKAALRTMDDLIWSVSWKQSAEERAELLAKLPTLVRRLNAGLEVVAMPDAERRRFMSSVADLQAAAMRGGSERGRGEDPQSAQCSAPASNAGAAANAAEKREKPGNERPETSREGKLILDAFRKANHSIYTTAQKRPECSGMGTTLVAAMFHDNRITFGHVGDSRLYRLRGDRFTQITVDHSLLQYLVTQGFYTPEEAARSGKKNYLIRAMGNEPDVQLDIQQAPVAPGDVYLICSDGLSDLVDDQTLHSLLSKDCDSLYKSAKRLVTAANERGGYDNISAILVRIKQPFSYSQTARSALTLDKAVEMAGISDVGMKRSHNEDNFEIDPFLGVAVLADGMGGYNAGEVASAIAVNGMMGQLRRALTATTKRPETPCDTAADIDSEARHLVEEVVLEDEKENVEPDSQHAEVLPAVETLNIGTWVEFCHSGQAARRARLSWISPSSGAFLFTDRHGTKVAEASPHGLSVQLNRGDVRILEKAPLFDRAVGKVMTHVRAAGAAQ